MYNHPKEDNEMMINKKLEEIISNYPKQTGILSTLVSSIITLPHLFIEKTTPQIDIYDPNEVMVHIGFPIAIGAITYLAGKMYSDIKTINKEKDQIKEAETRFQKLFENNPLPYQSLDQNKKIQIVNSSWLEKFGYEKSEVIGSNIYNYLEDDQRNSNEERYFDFNEFDEMNKEYKFKKKDGTIWIGMVNGMISYDENDKFKQFHCVLTDITKQKELENELRYNEQRFRGFFDDMPNLLCVYDKNGILQYVNQNFCKEKKSDKCDLIGNSIFSFIPEVKREEFIQDIKLLTVNNPVLTKEYKLVLENDSIQWTRWTNRAIFDELGEIIKYQSISEDVTEKKNFEEELEIINKLESIGILASGIAHDFNNYLTAINTNAHLAKLKIPKENEIYKFIDNIEKSIKPAKYLTGRLLTFSKGGHPVKRVSSLIPIIKNAGELYLSGKSSKSNIKIDPNLYDVEIDEGQIGSVIQNLIINAYQAMPNGGIIDITCENKNISSMPLLKSGDYVSIKVRDYGIGIQKDNIKKIFDPFYTTKDMGSGLGLTVSYNIIKAHEGWIHAQSCSVGTEFTIYLPAIKRKVPVETIDQIVTNIGYSGKILLLEDQASIAEPTVQLLELLGYEPIWAKEGNSAIEIYKANKDIKLIITDLTIPGGMGGKECIERISEFDPKVNAIAYSGYSEDPVITNPKKFGFKDSIVKPYSPEKLESIIKKNIKNT